VVVEQTEEIQVVRHDPSVVKFVAVNLFLLTIFMLFVNRV
jgi:biopolymer transport protein ExbD